jgi:sugar lactone lactonase YvrE
MVLRTGGIMINKDRATAAWVKWFALLTMIAFAVSCPAFASAEPPPLSQAVDSVSPTSEPELPEHQRPDTEGNPMMFSGGYVQHHPHVYVIFWGSEWNEHSAAREGVLDLYRTISGSAYADIITQYFDRNGSISNETALTSYTDTRTSHPNNVSEESIMDEVHYSINHASDWTAAWNAPNHYENQYVVLTPPSANEVGPAGEACGFHAWNGEPWQVSWTYIPWSEEPCLRGQLTPAHALQVTASHEWAESATDPIPSNAYRNGGNPQFVGWKFGESIEIGDLCNTHSPAEYAEIASGIFAAKLFDDYLYAANGTPCVAGDSNPQRFSASTGQSTVLSSHKVILRGTVSPAGWMAGYRFELTGPEGTTFLPSREGQPPVYEAFLPSLESVGEGAYLFSDLGPSVFAEGLKPLTTYSVRFRSQSRLTRDALSVNPTLALISDDETQFTTLPDPPIVTTDSVTNVKGTQATLNGTVNPNGVTASYQAECRKGSTEGAAVFGPKGETAQSSSNISVSATVPSLEPATTYLCRLIATNTGGSSQGEWATLETKAVGVPELSELPVTEPFNDDTSSYTDFNNLWSKLGWAEGKGEDTSGGWGTSSSTSGAYYSQAASDVGWGLATAATLFRRLSETNSHFSLWLDMPTPAGAKAGYELRFTYASNNIYNVTLSKWVGGTQTELASKPSYSFAEGSSFALADLGGRVTVFTDTGSGYAQLLSATDATYEGGEGGLEGHDSFVGLTNFELGSLTPQGKVPGVKTEAATAIKATKATLNGTVNPEGLPTTYYFEYGKTTSYGTTVPVGAGSAGSGSSPVAVSEPIANLDPGTTYHYRLVGKSEGKSKGEDLTFKTEAGISGSQLAALPLAEPFDGSSSSLADFESNFGTLHGSGGTTPKGNDYSKGWGPWDSPPTVNGTYYSPTFTDIGWGVAAEAKLNATPTQAGGQYFSLWIDMPTPASALIGYELRFTTISAGVFEVALYEWGGTPTKLASLGSYSMANGNSVALVDQGSKVSAWVDRGSGFSEVLSATDSTYSGGSAGLQGEGNATRMANFRAGVLRTPSATTEAANEIKGNSATLNGTVNPAGFATNYYFEYGPTAFYGSKIPIPAKEAGSGSSNVSVHQTPSGLNPGTTYHFRLVAESEAGTSKGEDKTFMTLKAPQATTEAASEVKGNSATLNGTVNPEGSATKYFFEYDQTEYKGQTTHGSKAPASPESIGQGTSNVSVHQTPSGMNPGTTYHFRLVAESAVATSYGEDRTLKTPQAPKATTEAASEIKGNSATLNGTVNPEGGETGYYFEYDISEYKEGEGPHGIKAPAAPRSAGSGFSDAEVNEAISGLEADTVYHYRIVASNEIAITYGEDNTLTTPDPRFDFAFGEKGSGNGQFENPTGIATDSKGNIWVADPWNDRVQEFNSEGKYLSQFGKHGEGAGEFIFPYGIAIDSSDNVWVADSGNDRVQVFNPEGKLLFKFGESGKGNGQFEFPTAIAFNSLGSAFVTDSGNNRVEKFSSSGKYSAQFGKAGTGNGEFQWPAGIAIDSANHIWVVDSENNRVQEFSSSLAYIGQFGKKGEGNGEFEYPLGIAIDFQGRIWVTDAGNNRVQKFNAEGKYLDQFGSYGSGPGQLFSPSGIAAPAPRQILVADEANHRISSWTLKAEPPTVTAKVATNVKAKSATLVASIDPESMPTSYWFEYGTSTSYGTKIPTSAASVGSGSANVTVEQTPTGLTPNTTYHFRAVAENSEGAIAYGADKTLKTLKAPKATTEAATAVKATQATLNGTINPEGQATGYWFEYGTSTSYGTKVPINAESVGSGTSNVAVHQALTGLSAGTTYHFRVVAESVAGGAEGGDETFTAANTADEIGTLPTLDALNRAESPLSGGGKWSALAWDTSTSGHNTGEDRTGGWGPSSSDSYPTIDGAYWNPSTFKDKTGDAAAITMEAGPGAENRYADLWLDMGSPGSQKSGYQLRWTYNPSSNSYAVKLSKWSSGNETVLASKASVTIAAGTTLAISDTGGTVTAWQGTGGSLTSILSASDTAFSEGYAGIDGSGNNTRLQNFKAGLLLGGAITGVSVLDSLQRQEVPLATGKSWTKTSWVEQIGGAWKENNWLGYGAQGAHLAGAYWNPTTFSDASGPILVSATLGSGPRYAPDYLSLWLDMPSPGSVRSGYEARFTGTDGYSTHYKVELSKWVSGTRTVLASNEAFSLPVGTTMALTETGGALTLWTGTSSFSRLLSATDSTYSSGYAGLEANEGEGTEYDFRAGGV